MDSRSAACRSCYEEDVAVFAGLEPDEPLELEPDELEPEEPEPDEPELEPAAAGVEAGVDDEESDLLSAAGAADFSALTFPARESLR
ncbi:hypothetical protein Aau02nite_02810 [Amorphoplanes auranticolor]|uniref:Uncharacterized protein n=1 Tax=Actinoplanes auranticolor TaxID=47988 RepID=A0A919S343_9ACTN|nr:hypothetical protein Aau02nite_02810 [Actinoplanes auranticolor]